MRLTGQQRHQNETRIRAAIDRLLQGQIPPGGKCDIKTLAREAGVDRTAFYGARPYARLREEFEARLTVIRQAGDTPDPREAQISRLKTQIAELQERLTRQHSAITELTEFKAQALSRLAAQHDELTLLRRDIQHAASIRRRPTATP
jgi:hypothetical protein